jgi:hypothetical protein
MDIDSIPLGFDYREQMRDALSDNKVMIAVIGPKWLGGRGKDARINANNDPVRIELETAFQQGMPIIPVLVSGATMPKASIANKAQRRTGVLIGQVILAAADVDADTFRNLSSAFGRVSRRTTLYVSSRDLAIEASRWLHDFARRSIAANYDCSRCARRIGGHASVTCLRRAARPAICVASRRD